MADPLNAAATQQPITPYPDVNAGVQDLLRDLHAILGAQFVGLYLLGSLALGDFDPKTSDLDLLIVTTDALADEMVAVLRDLHQRVERTAWPWARRMDAVYLPADALQKPMSTTERFPTLEWPGALALEPLEPGWPMQRYTLREYGVVVSGPDPRSLLDPVPLDELRQASRGIVEEWHGRAQQDPSWMEWLRIRSNHTFVVLTLCRLLYTLHTGSVASKPAAARWVEATLAGRFSDLIGGATIAQPSSDQVTEEQLRAALAFLEYSNTRYQQWRPSSTTQEHEG